MTEVLLTMADYYGTLAAARSFGRAGLGVVLADSHRFAPTCWSHYVTRTLPCPDIASQPEEFVEWLLALGEREPGRVLYATSDDVAWLFARHRAALSRSYRLYMPELDAVYALLNKWRLYCACVALGIDAPATWLPANEADLPRVALDASFPLVVKPQTQAFLTPHQKGRFVENGVALVEKYHDFERSTVLSPLVRATDPTAAAPILQAFTETAARGIYNLSGFIDETGKIFVAEASRKVLQWPPRLGIGLCFEGVDVLPELADDVARLCRHVGYYGAFEVEFLETGSRHLLIDFNPRFYGQMGFDISRGLDLPRLVYLGAIGARDELARAVEEARTQIGAHRGLVYCSRVDLELSLGLLRLAKRIDGKDDALWHAWLSSHQVVDAVLDWDDWVPGAVEAVGAVLQRAIHPRSTWRAARER